VHPPCGDLRVAVSICGNVFLWLTGDCYDKGTTRCAELIFEYKYAGFCIDIADSNRHQDSLGGRSEARPEAITLGSSD